MKRIKALNKREFDQSSSDGTVYGQWSELFVYIELGKEEEYRENSQDDSENATLNMLKL